MQELHHDGHYQRVIVWLHYVLKHSEQLKESGSDVRWALFPAHLGCHAFSLAGQHDGFLLIFSFSLDISTVVW
jgi:hypothetical protein